MSHVTSSLCKVAFLIYPFISPFPKKHTSWGLIKPHINFPSTPRVSPRFMAVSDGCACHLKGNAAHRIWMCHNEYCAHSKVSFRGGSEDRAVINNLLHAPVLLRLIGTSISELSSPLARYAHTDTHTCTSRPSRTHTDTPTHCSHNYTRTCSQIQSRTQTIIDTHTCLHNTLTLEGSICILSSFQILRFKAFSS